MIHYNKIFKMSKSKLVKIKQYKIFIKNYNNKRQLSKNNKIKNLLKIPFNNNRLFLKCNLIKNNNRLINQIKNNRNNLKIFFNNN